MKAALLATIHKHSTAPLAVTGVGVVLGFRDDVEWWLRIAGLLVALIAGCTKT